MEMNKEELEKLANYLEIYADAFNGLVQQALAGQSGAAEMSAPAMMVFDAERLKSAVSDYNNVNMKSLMENQVALMQQHMQLWQNTNRALLGLETPAATVSEEAGDRRFKDSEWNQNPVYSYIKQAYLLNAQMLSNIVDSIEFGDDKQKQKARFYTRQYINSTSPTNLALTNPEVCREILESKGENLVHGIQNFIKDLQQSPIEALQITQSDPDAFTLGENLATTPGKVVLQNKLIQLIQYQPSTEKVYKTPLLLIPPFINKFYIMDLDEKKSLVRWLASKGYTVFMLSWVNPDDALADTEFQDYVTKGVVAAIDAIEAITGSHKINAAGYCVGGTLLAISQAYLRACGDERLQSCTFITTLTNFEEPGELGAYLSEEMLLMLEQNSRMKGIFDGRILALSFNLLRENNLFWSYFINNYLKGKDPVAFDILYWNSDSTNIPAETFSYYLRSMYLENKLVEPGGIEIEGVAIDLGKIETPSYILSTLADHIVPWQAAYQSATHLAGPVRFVLGASGHVAGGINPEQGGKYPHWVNDEPCTDAESWKSVATEVSGSWWTDWDNWLQKQSGGMIKARKPGSKEYPPLEDAPGSYVKVRI
jgi:polyhydroxyalkanoate synthase subunit PhaC